MALTETQKKDVLFYMRRNVQDAYSSLLCGINMTALVEDYVWHSGDEGVDESWLDDETHEVWELALQVAGEYDMEDE